MFSPPHFHFFPFSSLHLFLRSRSKIWTYEKYPSQCEKMDVPPFFRPFVPSELHWVKNSSHVSIAPHVTINAIISLPLSSPLTKVACEEDREANFQ